MALPKNMDSKIIIKIIKFKIYQANNIKLMPIFAKNFFIQWLGENTG